MTTEKTIAQQLKDKFSNWTDFFLDCENLAVDIDQDWDAMSTVFKFADGSEITATNEIEVKNDGHKTGIDY